MQTSMQHCSLSQHSAAPSCSRWQSRRHTVQAQCISRPEQSSEQEAGRRQILVGGLATLAGLTLSRTPSAKADGFLSATGAKGPLVEEEQALLKLRKDKEGEARARLLEEKVKLEEEASKSMSGKLCATPFGIDVVGITEFVALVGALVGGVTARQRKEELERLNEQLRKINLSLRQQARAGTVYAPGLSYAPPAPGEQEGAMAAVAAAPAAAPRIKPLNPHTRPLGSAPAAAATAVAAPPAIAPAPAPSATTTTTTTSSPASSTIFSMEEEEMSAEQLQCREALRQGKRLLKERNGAAAMVRFEKALMLSKALNDKVQERRAMRGLAASARLQGQYRAAIKNLERVLEISKEMREFTGDADAYGTIADCYTDMGEFEKAAQFYDKYIETMNRDGPV